MQFQNLQDKMGGIMLTHNVHSHLPDYRRCIPQVRGLIFTAVIISTLLLEFTSQNQKY